MADVSLSYKCFVAFSIGFNRILFNRGIDFLNTVNGSGQTYAVKLSCSVED